MAGLKLRIHIKKGKTWNDRRLAQQFAKVLKTSAMKALGPGFAELMEQSIGNKHAFVSEVRANLRNLPHPDPSALKELGKQYKSVWHRLYMDWIGSYEQSESHEKFKEKYWGKPPYSSGPGTISFNRTGYMTGYLYGSLSQAFVELQDSEHIDFTNVPLLGGFRFKVDSYPRRTSPYRGHKNAQDSSRSYVQNFLNFLSGIGVLSITGAGRGFDFKESEWASIAMVMRKQLQKRIFDVFPEVFDQFEFSGAGS